MTQIKEPVRMMHLRMELDTDDIDYKRRINLVKHGKVAEGLIRDVIVPETMTLHALHYLIQKCFGWQNSHLHHFALPEELFDTLTILGVKPHLKPGTVFEPFMKLENFKRVYLDASHSVGWDIDPTVDSKEVWENLVDLCPDSCYMESVPVANHN